MSTTNFDGSLILSPEAKPVQTSSEGSYLILTMGDTIRIAQKRTIADGEKGFAGEICWDESFLYICIADDKWSKIKHAF